MATISSILPCPGLLQHSSTSKPKLNLVQLPSFNHGFSHKLKTSIFISTNPPLTKIRAVVAEDTSSSTTSSSGEGGIPRLYIGNIPRNINNDELRRIVEEHGAVEKAEVFPSSSSLSFKVSYLGFVHMLIFVLLCCLMGIILLLGCWFIFYAISVCIFSLIYAQFC